MTLLSEFTPLVEPVSIDEAFLDISGCERLFGSVETICAAIKGRIQQETGLTCSIGASHLRFLAKIASDMNKPDGIHIIEQSDAPEVIQTLSIKKVPGVGERAMGQMERLGLGTLGDISRIPPHILEQKFGKFAVDLLNFSQGIDPSTIGTVGPVKSISSESTLENDTLDMAVIKRHLLAHAQRVGRQLRAKELLAANITIKVKFSDFTQITRQNKLIAPICASTAIFREACSLFERTALPRKVRLLGVGVSSFSTPDTPVQLELFDPVDQGDERWAVLDRAVDKISRRFGAESITPASLKY
jgi:DNA polymerase-4